MLRTLLSLGLCLLLLSACKKGSNTPPVQLTSIEISTGEVYTFSYNSSNQLTSILYAPPSIDPSCGMYDPYCNKSSTNYSYTNNKLTESGFEFISSILTPGNYSTSTITQAADSIKVNFSVGSNSFNKQMSYRGSELSFVKREYFQNQTENLILKFEKDNEGIVLKRFVGANTFGAEQYRLKLSNVKNPFKLSNLDHPVIAEAYTYFIQNLGFNWNVKFAYNFSTMPSEIMYYLGGPKYVFTYQTRADGFPTKATAVNESEAKTVTVTYTYNN